MSATVADVRRIAPELATVSNTDIEGFLDDAALELSESAWDTLYNRAHALMAAHLVTCAHPELAVGSGGIASETAGPVSRSYAVAAPVTSDLSTTRHGLEYKRLLRKLGLSFVVP